MNIIEFFELSAGKWLSQRTIHNLASGELITGKSELNIQILPATDAAVVKLCQEYQRDPASATLGIQMTWDGTPGRDQPKQTGSMVWVSIIDPNHPEVGEVLLEPKTLPNTSVKCRCFIGTDDVLTLITESDGFQVEERLWYLMPNLRVRSSVVKQSDYFTHASFYSEIRMGVKPQ